MAGRKWFLIHAQLNYSVNCYSITWNSVSNRCKAHVWLFKNICAFQVLKSWESLLSRFPKEGRGWTTARLLIFPPAVPPALWDSVKGFCVLQVKYLSFRPRLWTKCQATIPMAFEMKFVALFIHFSPGILYLNQPWVEADTDSQRFDTLKHTIIPKWCWRRTPLHDHNEQHQLGCVIIVKYYGRHWMADGWVRFG